MSGLSSTHPLEKYAPFALLALLNIGLLFLATQVFSRDKILLANTEKESQQTILLKVVIKDFCKFSNQNPTRELSLVGKPLLVYQGHKESFYQQETALSHY